MNIMLLNRANIQAAITMEEAIEAAASAYQQFSAGKTNGGNRSRVQAESGILLSMPVYASETGELGVKIVTVFSENPKKNLPVVIASVLLFDPLSGELLAILDGTELTRLRTGAAGGLAAKIFSREDSEVATLIGLGVQGKVQLEALLSVRPLKKIFVTSLDLQKTNSFVQEARRCHSEVLFEQVHAGELDQAISQSDIIVTATSSSVPTFPGNALKKEPTLQVLAPSLLTCKKWI